MKSLTAAVYAYANKQGFQEYEGMANTKFLADDAQWPEIVHPKEFSLEA